MKSPIRMYRSPLSTAIGHHFLGMADRLRRIEPFRTRLRAVHDRVAAIEAERIVEAIEALAGVLIATVGQPAIRLQQDRRSEVLVLVPPVARARRRAAEAQDAFPEPV